MDEKPVATARASVMLFDATTNSWVASGSTQGISKVQLFRHQINNTYRVVGWKLNDKEVVLNCAIFRGLKYNQARPTFHQWRDTKHQVYGLNFTNKEEAEQFANAVLEALENLNQIYRQTQQIIAQQQQIDMQHGNYASEFQQQQQAPPVPQQQQQPQPQPPQLQSQPPQQQPIVNYQSQISGNSSMPEYALPQKQMQQNINVGSLNNIGDNYAYGAPASSNGSTTNEYRGSQQEEMPKIVPNPIIAAPPPPPPPGPPPPSAAPPPPPGPPPLSTITMGKSAQQRQQQQSNDSDEESNQSGLASQLRQARLKARGAGGGSASIDASAMSTAAATAAADISNQNKNVANSTATLGRAGGDSMMSEMQRVLAARKKAKEVVVKPVVTECNDSGGSGDSSTKNSQWRQNHHRSQSDCDQVNGANNQSKPVVDPAKATSMQCATLGRKGSLQPDQQQPLPSITRQDLDNFKREILQEVRTMIQQFKTDIIDVIRTSKP